MKKNDLMVYKGYTAHVEFSYEDQILYGIIEGIADLVDFQCENAADVEKTFHEAVDDYLTFCAEIGQEPGRAYKGSFNVRVDPDLHRRIDQIARRAGVSMNQIVERALSAYADSVTRDDEFPIYDFWEPNPSQRQVNNLWSFTSIGSKGHNVVPFKQEMSIARV